MPGLYYLAAVGAALHACINASFSFSRLHREKNVMDGKETLGMCLASTSTLTDIGAG
jgi:hypothetical protein